MKPTNMSIANSKQVSF